MVEILVFLSLFLCVKSCVLGGTGRVLDGEWLVPSGTWCVLSGTMLVLGRKCLVLDRTKLVPSGTNSVPVIFCFRRQFLLGFARCPQARRLRRNYTR